MTVQTKLPALSPDAATMHTYRLKFVAESGRPAKDLEFEAADAFQAMIIAHEEARHCTAELWRDGQRLCTINRSDNDMWQITDSDPLFPGR